MKKTVFIGITMAPAGTERAFLTYVSKMDFSGNDVTLLLAKKEGALLSQIPPQIHVRTIPGGEALFSLRKETAFKTLAKCFFPRHPLKAVGALRFLPPLLFGKHRKKTAERLWVYAMKATLPEPEEAFDTAVAFWGDHTMFYTAEKIKADKKVAWLHFEYDYPERDDALYGKYFACFDEINVVSERTRRMLREKFPSVGNRFFTVSNEIDAEKVKRLGNETGDLPIPWGKGVRLLSVGRINPVKGLDLLPPVLEKLKKDGILFSWMIVGGCDNMEYKEKLIGEIERRDLAKRVFFAGETANPYPYMKECDIFLQCSRSESFALAPREALVFDKTVICTHFPAAEYLKGENKNVILCDGKEEALYTAIKKAIENFLVII